MELTADTEEPEPEPERSAEREREREREVEDGDEPVATLCPEDQLTLNSHVYEGGRVPAFLPRCNCPHM